MANPIKISDLFNNDGSIKSLREEIALLAVEMERLLAVQSKLGVQQEKEIKNAKSLDAAIGKLNVTTAAEREEIEETAKQTEEIDKRLGKYAESLTEGAQKIEALKIAQQKANVVNKLNAKLALEQKGSYNALAAEYGLIKTRLNQMSKAQRENTKEGKNLVKQSKEISDEMKRLQEETGKNVLSVGDYGKALDKLGGPISAVIRDLTLFRDGLRAQVGSLRASVTGLTGGAKALKIFKLALISTGIGAFVVILGSLVAFLSKTQKGIDFVNKVFDGLSATVSVVIDRIAGFGEGLVDIFSGRFEEGAEKLRAATKGVGDEIREEAKAAFDLRDELNKLEDAEQQFVLTKSIVEKKISELRKQAAQEEKRNKKLSISLLKEAEDALESLFDQEINIARKRAEITNKQLALGNSTREELQAGIDATAKLNDLEAARNDRQRGLIKQQNSLVGTQKKAGEELAKAQEAYNQILVDQSRILDTSSQKAINGFEDQIEKLKEYKAAGVDVSAGIQFLEENIALAMERIRRGPTREVAELVGKDLGEALLKGVGEGIKTLDPQGVTEDARTFLEKVKDGIDKFADENEDIYDLLGFNLTDAKKSAITDSINQAKELINSLLDARIEAADRAVEIENNRVSSLEANLDREMQNRRDGFAENVALAQQQLAAGKKAQEEALKEQAKAQKAKERLATIEQATNLVTAASQIFATLPFFLAIPAVAIMFGTFIAAKIKAAQLSKKQFGEGGLEIIGGGSHASGNDTYLGFQSEGKAAYGERGEAHAIIPTRQTKKYKQLLPEIVDSLRKGTFERQFQKINAPSVNESASFFITQEASRIDLSKVEKDLSEIRRAGERTTVMDSNGNIKYEKYKNLVRYYA